MKLLVAMLLLALATVASASLLEMSQELWSRVLNGGYRRLARLDPLQVPVIKVDQSEGNTSYRAILRNLEIGGLNGSKIESVQMVRGRLKSNLRDGEAGYVSYNEQRDLDSIRYRFHTLVKERKGSQPSASDQFERIVEYDPAATRARDEEELLKSAPLDQQRFYASEERRRNRIREQQQQQPQFNGTSQLYYGEMRVALKPTPRNPASVRVIYTHNYKSQDGQVRPCVGACKPNQDATGRVEAQRAQPQQALFPPRENSRVRSRVHQEQRYSSDKVSEGPTSTSSIGVSNGQNDNRFSAGQFNSNAGTSYNFRSDQFSVDAQTGPAQGASQYSLKKPASGVGYPSNYEEQQSSARISVESNAGEFYGSNGQRQNQYAKGGAQFGGASFSVNNNNFRNGQLKTETQPGPESEIKAEKEESDKDFRPMTYFEDPSAQPDVMTDEYGYLCNPEEEHKPTRFQSALRRGSTEQTTQLNFEEFDPYKSPMIRMEKQPGYVDIVYASKNGQESKSSRSSNLKAASTDDPRVFGLEQLVKELSGKQRYIIHNFTEGESLRQRNDAARVAIESRRIKDLLRYAKEYQEKQGFFEEGMELIYHFGNSSSRPLNDSQAGQLARRKRQHATDKEEDDVMHVIVRMQVPKLSVKADYALMGKVGRQLLRGNGRLDGNFVNVTADFTVELKKVNNSSTMIVRAARAKLVSKDRDVKLEGMDEKGPVNDILANSAMAAEAVAAMIADDLATKAISEGDNEGTVYKMYKNLPLIEKS